MRAIDELKAEHANGGTPRRCACPQADGVAKPVEFSFFVPQQYGSAALLTQYPATANCWRTTTHHRDRAERLRQKSRELYKAVHNMHDRAVRKQAARREELAQSSRPIRCACTVSCCRPTSGAVHKGDRQVTVQNYYTGGMSPSSWTHASVPMRTRRNISATIKEADRPRHAAEAAGGRRSEIEYLATVMYEVESAPVRLRSTRSAQS